MRELAILVGPPASGKTALQQENPDWVVVSKNDIRACMYRTLYVSPDEETVERIYAAALVEAIGSDAAVVCVDDPNLRREERAALIELAHIAGRRPVAHVMPMQTPEAVEASIRENVQRLRREMPYVRVTGPTRRDVEELLASYAQVADTEGFYDVIRHAPLAPPEPEEAPIAERPRTRKRRERREPLPLFV